MTLPLAALHLALLLPLPILVIGIINRTKSLWAGRKGPPILQSLYDLRKLLRKQPVYSELSTPLFSTAPYVALGSALVAGLILPLLGDRAPLSFPFDFVFFAYIFGLGRVALILGALDTGSAFEGMGASREATFSALTEPALFLVVGTLGAATGKTTFAELLHPGIVDPSSLVVWSGCVVALFVILVVESARIPVDDPNTHLELTMIHEVMILDHSGPDLAALQFASALKLTVCLALLATLLNPLAGRAAPLWVGVANIALILAIAIFIGTVESLIARIKLRTIPQFIFIGIVASFVALLASTWRSG